jgi:hypothetical protein
MRKACLACLLAIAAAAAWSQPKVAVLDTIVPQSMDQSVVIPTTEKIIERLVVSGRFTVLDRANIESVLKEREFQLSGMVTDQDVVKAGKYLGADFVVVAKAQKVSDTYFISAKMINIKTGVIANQTSAQAEGKLSMLIDLAEEVGDVLSGGAVTAQSSVDGGQKDISKPESAPRPKPAKPAKPAASGSEPSGGALSLVLGIDALPTTWVEDYTSLYSGTYTVKLSYMAVSLGIDARYFEACASMGFRVDGTFSNDYNGTINDGDITDEESYVGIAAYAKLPIKAFGATLFPIVGAEYLLTISLKAADGTSFLDNLNSFGESLYLGRIFVEAGLGVDADLGSKWFMRGAILYGYKIPSSYDETYIADQESLGYTNESVGVSLLKANVAVGFRL